MYILKGPWARLYNHCSTLALPMSYDYVRKRGIRSQTKKIRLDNPLSASEFCQGRMLNSGSMNCHSNDATLWSCSVATIAAVWCTKIQIDTICVILNFESYNSAIRFKWLVILVMHHSDNVASHAICTKWTPFALLISILANLFSDSDFTDCDIT